MNIWLVTIHVWAYFGSGEKEVGPKRQEFHVQADDFEHAYRAAKSIMTGIKTNPHVWQTGVDGIVQKSYTTDEMPTEILRT